jgi:hypothetical protein
MTEQTTAAFDERDIVFNVTWTGSVYPLLRFFVGSLFSQSDARFRYLVNSCQPASVQMMHRFAERNPDRVVDVVEVSPEPEMIGHGASLNLALERFDDGEFFAMVDCDIKATGPFLGDFAQWMVGVDAISSGKEIWTEDAYQPEGFPGIDGRFFYRWDGFVYGSPHFAIYRSEALRSTMDNWGVHFATGGEPQAGERLWKLLQANDLDFWVYDTAKMLNMVLQLDGHTMVHREHDHLLHVGGVSHYLSPPKWDKHETDTGDPTWTTWEGMEPRAAMARLASATLHARRAGEPLPQLPGGFDDAFTEKMELVQREMVDMVDHPGPT